MKLKVVNFILIVFGLIISVNAFGANNNTVNLNVPYFHQVEFKDFGQSACMPTSAAMILKYYFPYSQVNPGSVYHSGTQVYTYYGPIKYYKNYGAQVKTFTAKGLVGDSKESNSYYSGKNSYGNIENLKKYLKNWGISLTSVDTTYEDVKNTLDNNNPILANVKFSDGGGHYVVIIGYDTNDSNEDNNTIYINDPYIVKFDQKKWAYYSRLKGENSEHAWGDVRKHIGTHGFYYFKFNLEYNESYRIRNFTTLVGPSHTKIDGYNNYSKYQIYNYSYNNSKLIKDDNKTYYWYNLYDDNNATDDGKKLNKMEIDYKGNDIKNIYYYYGKGRSDIFLNDPKEEIDSIKWKPALKGGGIFDIYYNYNDDGASKSLIFKLKYKNKIISETRVNYANSKTSKHILLFKKQNIRPGYYVEVDKVPYNVNLGSILFYHRPELNSYVPFSSKFNSVFIYTKNKKSIKYNNWVYNHFINLQELIEYLNMFSSKNNLKHQITLKDIQGIDNNISNSTLIDRGKFANIIVNIFNKELNYSNFYKYSIERIKIIIKNLINNKTWLKELSNNKTWLKENGISITDDQQNRIKEVKKALKKKWYYKWTIENKWTTEGLFLKLKGIWNGYKGDMLIKSNITPYQLYIIMKNFQKYLNQRKISGDK